MMAVLLKLIFSGNGRLRSKMYDKHDDFKFPIANLTFPGGIIPTPPAYGLLGLGYSLVHHDICSEIMYVDCKTEAQPGNKLYKDNNGNIYENFCLYSQAKCRDESMDIESICTCERPAYYTGNNPGNNPVTSGTSPPIITVNQPVTSSVILPQTTPPPPAATQKMVTNPPTLPVATKGTLTSLFCTNKDNIACPSQTDQVCGNDGITYQNRCEFAKGQCDTPNLSIAKEGAC